MGGRRRGVLRMRRRIRLCMCALGVVLIFVVGGILAVHLESHLNPPIENAGELMTVYSNEATGEWVFMNGQWHAKKDVDTLLVIGVDGLDRQLTASNSYNNSRPAAFLALYVRDAESGESTVIHLNRDTMTQIPVLGVTGQSAGSMYGQLALAFNYGRGEGDSSRNTVHAVSHLLYGIDVDHYITVAMDAVPIVNDWVGGVTLEIADDFTGIDDALVQGTNVTLHGDQALTYVRTRRGLDDSTNIRRMERQRQYASAWLKEAKPFLQDENAVADLMMSMSDYHYSDCTAEELVFFAEALAETPSQTICELEGRAVQGEVYMEYHLDETAVQNLVLSVFYEPVNA